MTSEEIRLQIMKEIVLESNKLNDLPITFTYNYKHDDPARRCQEGNV